MHQRKPQPHINASATALSAEAVSPVLSLELGAAIAELTAREYRQVYGVPKPGNLAVAVARGLHRLEA